MACNLLHGVQSSTVLVIYIFIIKLPQLQFLFRKEY